MKACTSDKRAVPALSVFIWLPKNYGDEFKNPF